MAIRPNRMLIKLDLSKSVIEDVTNKVISESSLENSSEIVKASVNAIIEILVKSGYVTITNED